MVLKKNLRRRYYENITRFRSPHYIRKYSLEKKIDLILVTGDLIDRGGTGFVSRTSCFETFENAFAMPLLRELSVSRDRLYFVPGNHDVWRDNDSKVSEVGLRQILNGIDEVNKYVDGGSQEGIKRILPFKKFEKSFYNSHGNCSLSNYQSLFRVNIDSQKVGVACLNTSWRSYEDGKDRHNLLVGERQITSAKTFFKDTSINIALLHHPIDWLADFDRRCVEPLVENTFHLVFCGHIHSGSSWVKSDVYKGLFVSVAPTTWSLGLHETTVEFCNGYS